MFSQSHAMRKSSVRTVCQCPPFSNGPGNAPRPHPTTPANECAALSHPGVLDHDSQPALTSPTVQNQCFLVQNEPSRRFRGQAGASPWRQALEKETDESGMSPQGGVSRGHPCFLPRRGVGSEGGPGMGIKGAWVT